ncbi:MAG: MmgE/PrpD family protein [Gemmatimonadota bacterium]|nr:MmgE/PrpD family protein [Gemmatimonadota bacterium]
MAGPDTAVRGLAAFATRASFEAIPEDALEQLKIRVLDAIGCAIGAVEGDPVRRVRRHVEALGGEGRSTLLGGGRTAPDRAALYDAFLVRYLDYNDSYLAPGETCHPSDNLGAVLAAAEDAGASGRDLLAALGVAYQVQCRLSDEAPVRAEGFDHVVQLAYGAAAGVARALGLEEAAAANGIAIAGTAQNALRVTRTGTLSHWKGLAAPWAAAKACEAVYLAREGITGPPRVFEGNKGFEDSIAGDFEIDWEAEGLDRVRRTIVKRYNAEIHSQSTLEGALELGDEHGIDPGAVDRVEIDTFDVAYHIIGGGEEGEKKTIRTKEEADHSLPYMVAVALLDGTVTPAQYAPERIESDDVQSLLRRVEVEPDEDLSGRFPDEMPVRVRIVLEDGTEHEIEKRDYEGFHTRPMRWGTIAEKFDRLVRDRIDGGLRDEIVDAVRTLEERSAVELAGLLGRVPVPSDRPGDSPAGWSSKTR